MRTEDFELMSTILRDRSGLVLSRDKVYLLETRLNPIAKKRGHSTLEAFIQDVRRTRDNQLLVEITEAMTTNESFFFRDKTPFDLLRDVVLPELLPARAAEKRLKIWCAAASTGQEPYSIAMLIREMGLERQGWQIDILATDLANEVLNRAKLGKYSQFEVQRGLPVQLLVKYFKSQGDHWQIDSAIRAMVRFQQFNLLDSLRPLGRFDVVFCRNVLIYFDLPTKGRVLDHVSEVMPQDGALFLGAAETVLGISEAFQAVRGQRGLYKPKS